MPELEDILKQERELREKLAQIEALKAVEEEKRRKLEEEKRRKEELSRKVVVHFRSLHSGAVLVENEYREDVVRVFQSIPGRMFRGYNPEKLGRNLVPVAQLGNLTEKLENLENVEVWWQTGLKEEIDWYLNAPPWEVTVHPSRRHLIVKIGPRNQNWNIFYNSPGSDWDYELRSWRIPTSEAWRVFNILKDIEGVVYSPDAKEIVFKQVEARTKIDQIAKKEDSDLEIFSKLSRKIYIPRLGKEIPFGEAMMGFQRVGVEFGLATDGRLIIGDQTGLGKTWQAIAYAEVRRLSNPDYQTIIVCKAGHKRNWEREVERLTGIKPVVCAGGKPEYFTIKAIAQDRTPYVIINYDIMGSSITTEKKSEVNGVEVTREITAYPWATVINSANPNLLVLDEAHMIKTPDAQRTRGTHQLVDIPEVMLLTASPILNRTEELWSLLYMLDPVMFKSHGQFVNTYTFGGKRPRNVDQLHELLRPRFIRRLKKDVQPDLPPINRMLKYHEISDRGLELYQKVLQGVWEMVAEFDPQGIGGGTQSVASILAQITRLKQVCAIDTVDTTSDLATEIVDGSDNGGKVLIFTHFLPVASAIAQRLGHEAVSTVRRTPNGFVSLNPKQRDELFESVRHDPKIRFIITTEASKEGHNLEFCDWVIFNDLFWSPESHNQCEGRAYGRLSNPHPIDSYYVLADVDIMHWIWELLQGKIGIIDETIEGIEATRDSDGSLAMDLIRKIRDNLYMR